MAETSHGADVAQEKKGFKLHSILDKLRSTVEESQPSHQKDKKSEGEDNATERINSNDIDESVETNILETYTYSTETASQERISLTNDAQNEGSFVKQASKITSCESISGDSSDNDSPSLTVVALDENKEKQIVTVISLDDEEQENGVTVLPLSDDVRAPGANEGELVEGDETPTVTVIPMDEDDQTVVPLNDGEQSSMDGITGEAGERLTKVWMEPNVVAENIDRKEDEIGNRECCEEYTEDDLPSHVKCTGCGKKVKTTTQKLIQHPVLGVLICKSCNKFYNSSSFSRDRYGMEEFCKWCGDGGELICCDFCEKVFCEKCVKRNMGGEFLEILLDADEEKWKCFSCDPSQIEAFVEESKTILKLLKKLKMGGYAFENKKTHLGGPSQLERKDRLINITHTLEDEGLASDEIIRIDIDPDIAQLEPDDVKSIKVKGGEKKRIKGSKKVIKNEGTSISKGHKDAVLEIQRPDEAHAKKLQMEEIFQKHSLKDFHILVERIAVPWTCSSEINVESDATFDDNMETVSLKESGDEESALKIKPKSKKEKNNSKTREDSDNEFESDEILESSFENEDEESNLELGQDQKDDLKVENDIKMEDFLESNEELDDSSDESSNDLAVTRNSSESDFDYQRLANRSIRNRGRNTKRQWGRMKKMDSKSPSADEDSVEEKVMRESSEDSSRIRKRSKAKRKLRKMSSDSDSDFASRKKKRPRRRREKISDESSESSSKSDSDDESDMEEGERDIKKRGKKKKGVQSRGKGGIKGKGKRGKKKQINSDSDDSSDEDEKSPSKSKGRKNIRRILADEELTEETRKARQLEEERRRRLLERTQATYAEEQAQKNADLSGRVALERDKKTGEPLVEVHESLVGNLKPHQVEGIQFMYDCLFESLEKFKNGDRGNGALLAHCMGLGKTLQIISLLHTVTNHPQIGLKRFLVVAPLNTVYNWETEFEKWLELDERLDVHVLADAGNNMKLRMSMLKNWYNNDGVMILGYDMYRNLTQFKRIKNRRYKKIITETLLDPGPDIVICDEGHILRNDLSAISKALTNIKTLRRIVLTGTPLQNNLLEYFVMVSFVKPKLLGTKKEFTNLFMNPIQNGQCANSTPYDVKIMKQRCHVLHDTLSGCVQRKDYSVLTPFLTPKHEYTIFVRLGERQRKMYQFYLDTFVCGNLSEVRARGASLFSDYQCLMKIWTHPWAVKLEAIRRMEKENLEDIREFLNDSESESESGSDDESRRDKWASSGSEPETGKASTAAVSSENSDEEPESNVRNNKGSSKNSEKSEEMSRKYLFRSKRNLAAGKSEECSGVISVNNGKSNLALDKNVFSVDESDENSDKSNSEDGGIIIVQPKEERLRGIGNTRSGANFKEGSVSEDEIEEKEWYDDFIDEGDDTNVELSGKIVLLLEILANAEIVGDKVLVFSQSLVSLDLIERSLGGGKIGGNEISWCKGVDYFRIDGSTNAKARKRYADIFNDTDNTTARLFIISTKAGSLGINLVAANRVIVFDCSWNPSHDVQSIFRVYRFGQDKPVYVYRFISQGTMEQKIYERQINKLALSGRVVDEQQISRHFTDEELRELYAFNAEGYIEGDEVPTPQLPADPLLAEVLQRQHPKWITKYHEHDILLENVEDEQLTEEERRQAWANYEEQKNSAERAIAYQQQRQQIYEMHRQQMQQQQQQQQQQNVEIRIQQQEEMLRRLSVAMQTPSHQPSYPGANYDPRLVQQRPASAVVSEASRLRYLQLAASNNRGQMLNNVRGQVLGMWNPALSGNVRPGMSVPRVINQLRTQVIDINSLQNAPMRGRAPLLQNVRSAVNLADMKPIRITNVQGSFPRHTSFHSGVSTYIPPRG